jgi:hypothetical protein
MYHDRTAWRCEFFVGKKYGCSKGYPQRNAAHLELGDSSALLSPSSDGKPEAATAVVAPDDGHEDARNMLSCI